MIFLEVNMQTINFKATIAKHCALLLAMSTWLATSPAFADPMKIDDLKVGSVVSEQIELPQTFSSDYMPLPPGNWVVQAIDPVTTPSGVRTGSTFLTLSNQDGSAKVPLISVGLSKKTGLWEPTPCQGPDSTKRIYYSSIGDMPTSPNEGKCATITDFGRMTRQRTNLMVNASVSMSRYKTLWTTAATQSGLIQDKFTQALHVNTGPWGNHDFSLYMLVDAKKEDIASNDVVDPQLLDWIHLNADLLTQAAKGKKVSLTALPL